MIKYNAHDIQIHCLSSYIHVLESIAKIQSVSPEACSSSLSGAAACYVHYRHVHESVYDRFG